jgi:hypothetical protein
MIRWNPARALLLAATVGSLAVPVAAQDETLYARSSNWAVERSAWDSFEDSFKKNTQPVLEKLFADGVITEWWFDADSLHSEDGYTHSIGWSATSLANVERVLDALDEANEKLSEEERTKRTRAFATPLKKHRDRLLRSVVYRSRTATIENGYFGASANQAKRGKGRAYRDWWKQYLKPVYDQLFEDGVLTAYGLDVEYLHQTPGLATDWFAVADADGLDKVEAAFASAFGGRSSEERRAIFDAVREISVPGTHRDFMSRIIHYSVKEGSYSN